jgi:hypothetical protein
VRRGSGRDDRALAGRDCRMRAIYGRPSWRRWYRGKPRGSPRCYGAWSAGCRPRRQHSRRRGLVYPAGVGCTAKVRRAGTSLLATVTRYGRLPGALGRRGIRTRRVGVACARVKVSAARLGQATQPSSKASQHHHKGDPLRTSQPPPLARADSLPQPSPACLRTSAARQDALAREVQTTYSAGPKVPCRYGCMRQSWPRALLAEQLSSAGRHSVQ